MSPGIRGLLARLALLLFGLGAAVVLSEVVVRVADPHARDHALPAGFFTFDRDLGWRQRANHTVMHRTRYFSVTYTTNARGYRDADRSDQMSSNRTRIVLFGDSQVLGWGIPRPQRFSDLLEARHPHLEVWNRAVMGYGLDQQLLDYERTGGQWDADAVVLFATRATLGRMETGYIYRKHKPRFVIDSAGAPRLIAPPSGSTTLTTVTYRLLSPWYLPYFLERRLEALRGATRGMPPGVTATPDLRSGLDSLAAAVLARAAATARARGHRLVLLADVPQAMAATLRRHCVKHGIRVLTVDFPDGRLPYVFGPEDPHWNLRGHERVAERFWEQWSTADGSRPLATTPP